MAIYQENSDFQRVLNRCLEIKDRWGIDVARKAVEDGEEPDPADGRTMPKIARARFDAAYCGRVAERAEKIFAEYERFDMLKAQASRLPEYGQVAQLSTGSRWMHRNGGVYVILFLFNEYDTPAYPLSVCHQSTANGKRFGRPAADWHRSYVPEEVAIRAGVLEPRQVTASSALGAPYGGPSGELVPPEDFYAEVAKVVNDTIDASLPSDWSIQQEVNKTWSAYEGGGFRKGDFSSGIEAVVWIADTLNSEKD